MIRVGVVGYGYWGPNLLRNFAEAPGLEPVAVSDLRQARLALAQSRYPKVTVTKDYREIIESPETDAIAIATPVSTHFEVAMQALRAGKHVFLEKPFTDSSEHALRLIEEAEKRNLVLMVDHTFVYTGAVRKIKELITAGHLGDVYYYDSVRINLGLFQHDVNVLWDLAVHDLSILDYLFPERPCAVSATGISHVPGEPENIGYMTLFFENKLMAHIHVNWLAPVKVRRAVVGGSQKMVVYDDIEPSEKVKVYDKGIAVDSGEGVYKMLISYRAGDMWAPHLDISEALRVEAEHFGQCIEKGLKPVTDSHSGLNVVQILEAATRSMQARGSLVELNLHGMPPHAQTRPAVVGAA